MINKHKDIETNISSSNIDIGDIGCRFYTEDENTAFIRINIKYDGQPVDLTDNEEMKPKLDLFMQDGSIFIDEPLEILIPESGSMQYNIPNKVIKHVGKVNCKLFLDNGTKSVHVSNFSFTIVDSGVEDVVAKEISVNLVKDTVKRIISEDLTEVLDDGFKEKLTDDLKDYVFEVVESIVGKGIEDINNRNIWEEVLKFGIEKGLIKQDGGSDFVVGTQPPTDKNKIWIDTGVSD